MVRLTLRHRHAFGADSDLVGDELTGRVAWDRLRLESQSPFGLPDDLEAWSRMAYRDDIRRRASEIDTLLGHERIASLASYGVGNAVMEWNLYKSDPGRRLVLTEFAPGTVERLKELAVQLQPPLTVVRHDVTVDPPLDVDLHLFHRIDSELTDAAWRGVFENFRSARVLFVATQIVGVRQIASSLRHKVRLKGSKRAGWMRNRAAFDALWARTHVSRSLVVGDCNGWLLEPLEG